MRNCILDKGLRSYAAGQIGFRLKPWYNQAQWSASGFSFLTETIRTRLPEKPARQP
jgi:hypothetical protein